jgi:PAS domain S-box-containing protein
MGGISDALGAEAGRITALYAYGVLDTPEEPAFDRLSELAARILQTPFAVISFVDRDREWFKSRFGLTIEEVPREGSLGERTVQFGGPIVIEDTKQPVRLGGVKIRFYAAAPIVTPDGQVIGVVAVMDTRPRAGITEDHLASLIDLASLAMHEIELQREVSDARLLGENEAEGEAKFRALMESASQAIIAVNARGRIEVVNNKAEELFDYSRDEMIGHPLEMLLPDRARDAHVQHRTNYFRAPHPRPMGIGMELAGRKRNGVEFPVEISLNYVEFAGRSLAISFITDISERLRLESQLRQSQKMEAIGQLAGGVAHDFNNLLTIIQGYSSMSLDGLEPEHALREPIEEIEKAAISAAALTRQLLAFSRRQIVQPRVMNLNTVIQQVEKMLRRVIGEDVDLVLATADDLDEIRGDPGLIEQILMNLAVNARDAMPNGGQLILETANLCLDKEYAGAHLSVKTGPHAMLAVTDTGTGMTEDVRAHIFEPFFTTKPLGQGTGLGLATVYGIVQQMDGSIWVYSELDRGTTFKILFPTAPKDAVDAARTAELPSDARGVERIMLVEDEAAVRKFVRTMLEKQGYTVLDALDPEDALRLVRDRAQSIDLLLTDVIMPRMNGPELAQQIQAIRPDLPVLYMSGYTDRAIRLQDRLGGDAHFIQKPFTPAALGQKLRALLKAEAQGLDAETQRRRENL